MHRIRYKCKMKSGAQRSRNVRFHTNVHIESQLCIVNILLLYNGSFSTCPQTQIETTTPITRHPIQVSSHHECAFNRSESANDRCSNVEMRAFRIRNCSIRLRSQLHQSICITRYIPAICLVIKRCWVSLHFVCNYIRTAYKSHRPRISVYSKWTNYYGCIVISLLNKRYNLNVVSLLLCRVAEWRQVQGKIASKQLHPPVRLTEFRERIAN